MRLQCARREDPGTAFLHQFLRSDRALRQDRRRLFWALERQGPLSNSVSNLDIYASSRCWGSNACRIIPTALSRPSHPALSTSCCPPRRMMMLYGSGRKVPRSCHVLLAPYICSSPDANDPSPRLASSEALRLFVLVAVGRE
jgi:hypothetical protein